MRRNEKFVLEYLDNVPYIMPVGQMTADMSRGISLNFTGVFLWDILKDDIELNDLIRLAGEHFGIPADDESLKKDIGAFVSHLKDRGMLEGSKNIFRCSCSICSTQNMQPAFDSVLPLSENEWNNTTAKDSDTESIKIGGVYLVLHGDQAYFPEDFEAFKTDEVPAPGLTMHIEIKESRPDEDSYYDNEDTGGDASFTAGSETEEEKGAILIHDRDLTVIEFSKEYVLFFTELKGIESLHLTKDGCRAIFFCSDPPSEEMRFSIFHAIRMAFLIFALNHGLVMLHSASILYNGYAWLFSGPSGTGKSTHTGIWNRLYNTPIINGDLNLLKIRDGIAFVYGTPWCGSSGIFDNKAYPVGGIIFLKQGARNIVQEISSDKKLLFTENRLITSLWDKDMLSTSLDIVRRIVKDIYIRRYFCNMEDSAAETLRTDIDSYLSKKSENIATFD